MKILLGNDLHLDLDSLIDTRLLIQANSGGGKSYAVRKILEETHGHVQQIILDIEGDFASLREKLDYILASKNGDIGVNPRSAELLARKVLELKADIIIDLYELKQHERIRFIKLFLDSMINAPKELWHPVLVIIDEAHIFAPEKGQAESMGAVIDLMTRGRKRGFCGILATQRLSKLHKDAAAECNNKLIGRTGIDIDVKRASDELGITPKEGMKLRDLNPGEFFVFGPAISKVVALKTIGEVKTHHPSAGNRKFLHTPEPTGKVKSILSKLTDLPKEAEQELKDKESMQVKIGELNRQIRTMERQSKDTKLDEKDLEKIKQFVEKSVRHSAGKRLKDSLDGFMKAIQGEIKIILADVDREFPIQVSLLPKSQPHFQVQKEKKPVPKQEFHGNGHDATRELFGKCERSILGFLLARADDIFTKVQIGAMTGYSHGSGGFNNALSRLYQSGLIYKEGDAISVFNDKIDEIKDIVGNHVDHTLEDWIHKLGKCEKAIYEVLLENPGKVFEKNVLAETTNPPYSANSGGFNNSLSRLSTLGLIKKSFNGIKLNEEIQGL